MNATWDLDVLLPDGPAGAAAARSCAASWLREHGLDPFIDDVVLVVSELAANAGEHGAPPARLRLALVPGMPGWLLAGEVSDAGRTAPRPAGNTAPAGDPGAERGRGLGIVAALMTVSGIRCSPAEGSTAWFRLDLPAGQAAIPAAA